MKNMGLIIGISIIVLFVSIIVGMYFMYNNREIALRKEAEAQEKKIETVYDKMWKVISQKAQVTSEYKDSFREIYKDIIAGRYENDGSGLMKWITEANPNFDSGVFIDLMNTIEVLRAEFATSQARMVDICREHATLISVYPSKWFITNKTPIDYEVISSTQTKDIVGTRLDDDVDVFKTK